MIWAERRNSRKAAAMMPRGVESVTSECPPKELYRLIYSSVARPPGEISNIEPTNVDAIQKKASKKNSEVDVSGVLISVRGVFIQILEGDPADIEPVFERICCDFRHSKVSLLEFGPAERRHFGEWSMVSVDDVTAADPEQLEDLLTSVSAGLPPSTIVRKVRSLLDGDA